MTGVNQSFGLERRTKKWHYEKAKFIAARTRTAAVKSRLQKARRQLAKDRNNRVAIAAKRWKKYNA
jgi:division protein CdvB (Snf7/Vps24/ESCRT-III family)